MFFTSPLLLIITVNSVSLSKTVVSGILPGSPIETDLDDIIADDVESKIDDMGNFHVVDIINSSVDAVSYCVDGA